MTPLQDTVFWGVAFILVLWFALIVVHLRYNRVPVR